MPQGIPPPAGDRPTSPATTPSVQDDPRDLAAAMGGDQAAFARLYDRHAPVVLSLCRRNAAGEAEDATQETFMRAFSNLDRLEQPQKLRPWLYGIARRVCSERRRSASRRRAHETKAGRHAERDVHPPSSLLGTVQDDEQMERLTAAIDQLDDRQRLAVHLYYLDADPVQAAREALGLSRSGYYKLLARARERLETLIREKVTA